LIQKGRNDVETATIENDLLRLPERIAKKLRGKIIEIAEIKEGILLKQTGNPIAEARGFLKGKRFSTKKYLEMKMSEKDLES
jgi:hypothetical protein